MTKYSVETKLEAVNAYLDGVESYKTTAEKHQVNVSMLKRWVANFREHGVAAFQTLLFHGV
jgi:transposase-like protein